MRSEIPELADLVSHFKKPLRDLPRGGELLKALVQPMTICTPNRALEEWYPLFRDDLMASAAMDRLLHHAHVLTMEGDSYRNPPRGRKQ